MGVPSLLTLLVSGPQVFGVAVVVGALIGAAVYASRSAVRRHRAALRGLTTGAFASALILSLGGFVALTYRRRTLASDEGQLGDGRWPSASLAIAAMSPLTRGAALSLLPSEVRASGRCEEPDLDRAELMCDLGMPCEAAVRLLRRCGHGEQAFHLAERFDLRGEIPTRVSGEGYEGVIFPRDDRSWTPTPEDVSAFEARFEPFMRAESQRPGSWVRESLIAALRTRKRQYSGVFSREGRRLLCANVFAHYREDWRYVRQGSPSDGGDSYVTACFDVQSARFVGVQVNGDA